MMTDMKGGNSVDFDMHALRKQWDEILCPICMEHPHNAVVLICSSYDKGCRCYICDTSYRHSNCLDRFKKLRRNPSGSPSGNRSTSGGDRHVQRSRYGQPLEATSESSRIDIMENHENNSLIGTNNVASSINMPASEESRGHNQDTYQDTYWVGSEEHTEDDILTSDGVLKCPLCRGTVVFWKIVKDVRKYLDLKPRSCSRESCSHAGNYRELRRHARRAHPTSRPGLVDPSRQSAWHRMVHQREYGDVLSSIQSAMPNAIVLGDYVFENGDHEGDAAAHNGERVSSSDGSGPWWTTFFLFHMMGSGTMNQSRSSTRPWRRFRRWRSSSSRHRYVWGENLLGLHGDNDPDDRHLEGDDDSSTPRRGRGLTRSRTEEEEELP